MFELESSEEAAPPVNERVWYQFTWYEGAGLALASLVVAIVATLYVNGFSPLGRSEQPVAAPATTATETRTETVTRPVQPTQKVRQVVLPETTTTTTSTSPSPSVSSSVTTTLATPTTTESVSGSSSFAPYPTSPLPSTSASAEESPAQETAATLPSLQPTR